MPFNASGFFQRLFSWRDDRDAGVKILAERMDQEMDGIVAGINDIVSGNVDWKGSMTGVFGTSAAPAYSFQEDSDTGIYRESTNTLGFSLGGVSVALLDENGFTVNGAVDATKFNAGGTEYNTTAGGWFFSNWNTDTQKGMALFADNNEMFIKNVAASNPTANSIAPSVLKLWDGANWKNVLTEGSADFGRYGNTHQFTVGGDANTYYPVRIDGPSNFDFADIGISRHYNWPAPNSWNTSTHKGGLTLNFRWSGDGNWGGNDKTIRIVQFAESYTSMVGGIQLSTGGVIVWLRGGGARYNLTSSNGKVTRVQIYATSAGYTDSRPTNFVSRTGTPDQIRANRQAEIDSYWPVRGNRNGVFGDMVVKRNSASSKLLDLRNATPNSWAYIAISSGIEDQYAGDNTVHIGFADFATAGQPAKSLHFRVGEGNTNHTRLAVHKNGVNVPNKLTVGYFVCGGNIELKSNQRQHITFKNAQGVAKAYIYKDHDTTFLTHTAESRFEQDVKVGGDLDCDRVLLKGKVMVTGAAGLGAPTGAAVPPVGGLFVRW
ncbi:hypothetical protein [Vibrio penaeicida]|uniref:hypothetical protein n=1 Tax=Vibrio penaeicida TaxID=104609 RepID=UPI001CC6F5B3|nr:hypothetical protein [Vibrio penaeicida]